MAATPSTQNTFDQVSQRLELFARELLAEGLAGEALTVLAVEGRALNKHEALSALPCLCQRCGFGGFEARADGGLFLRDFTVRLRWVLHYWVPAELVDARGWPSLREAMRSSLGARLTRISWARAMAPREDGSSGEPSPEIEALLEKARRLTPDTDTDPDIPFLNDAKPARADRR